MCTDAYPVFMAWPTGFKKIADKKDLVLWILIVNEQLNVTYNLPVENSLTDKVSNKS